MRVWYWYILHYTHYQVLQLHTRQLRLTIVMRSVPGKRLERLNSVHWDCILSGTVVHLLPIRPQLFDRKSPSGFFDPARDHRTIFGSYHSKGHNLRLTEAFEESASPSTELNLVNWRLSILEVLNVEEENTRHFHPITGVEQKALGFSRKHLIYYRRVLCVRPWVYDNPLDHFQH